MLTIAKAWNFAFDWIAYIIERQADKILIARLSRCPRPSDNAQDAIGSDTRPVASVS
jgi:hypothetical protein